MKQGSCIIVKSKQLGWWLALKSNPWQSKVLFCEKVSFDIPTESREQYQKGWYWCFGRKEVFMRVGHKLRVGSWEAGVRWVAALVARSPRSESGQKGRSSKMSKNTSPGFSLIYEEAESVTNTCALRLIFSNTALPLSLVLLISVLRYS